MERYYIERALLNRPLPNDSYLRQIPAVAQLAREGALSFASPVTFLVGENGSGKSTLLEALAVAAGFNAEGGSKNLRFQTQPTHSALGELLTLERGTYPKDGYFLRAESFYNVATALEQLDDPELFRVYGGKSLHEQSHGESFLALAENRLRGPGLYLLDEPEAALSPARQMMLLALMHALVRRNAQFIIATHSPILMAYPDARLLQLDEHGLQPVAYRQTANYQLTRRFLNDPEKAVGELLDDPPERK